MSLLIAGTAPIKDLPLISGTPSLEGNSLRLGGYSIPCSMGTAVMVFASYLACKKLDLEPPIWVTAGDIGDSHGSKAVYKYLIENLGSLRPKLLALHYMMPIILLAKELMDVIRKVKPILVADAGSMYVMKVIGAAKEFDLFTPDPGEMAFLADPKATHPAYMQHYLFEIDTLDVPRLIEQAYAHGNASKVLLVKGSKDYIAKDGKVVAIISEPNIPVLEPIGGTGDTITGVASALIYSGMEVDRAAIIASKTNRMAGMLANPTTATRSVDIAMHIPKSLEICLREI